MAAPEQGYAGLDYLDAADWGPGGGMGGEKRSYNTWINSKLIEGGYPVLSFESMFDDFGDGVVLAHLIYCLEDPKLVKKYIHGIDERRPLHPLRGHSNFLVLYKFLTEQAGIKGMSSLPINAVMHGSQTLIMGLIFRLMQKYALATAENDEAFSSLLEWVKPRCSPHKEVKNWTSSWKDGKALCALWNYLITEDQEMYEWLVDKSGQELTIDLTKCTTDTNAALTAAMSKFHKIMDVPLMITPTDMIECVEGFKKTNQIYIAEIKNAHAKWYDETKKKLDMDKASQQEANEDLEHITIGLEKYEQALKALREAQNSSNTMTTEILHVAGDDMSNSDGTDEELDKICDVARDKLTPNDEQYDYSSTLFEEAYTEFAKVKGREASKLEKQWQFKSKMNDAKAKPGEIEGMKDATHDNLDIKLEELKNKWKGKKALETLLAEYIADVDKYTDTFETITDRVIRSFEGTRNERQRRENVSQGRKELVDEVTHILEFVPRFDEVSNIVVNEDDQKVCEEKKIEAENWYNFWVNEYDRRVEEELNSGKYAQEEELADLLAIYHKFSVDLDTIVRKDTDENGNLINACLLYTSPSPRDS
eukprot:TRINITY_DN1031_c0_g2_i3.p1 TRINITY_DN1031_c0_g2~~TRINITY_DN1031_c0_g2_i3.p1  ORF type:complete len:592 (+),score=204.67 TRINITY_DN1031_c0_g2_i3:167-1942(+)